MSSDPRSWNPQNRQELSTALKLSEGDVIVLGEAIRVEVVKVGTKKVRLRINAPDSMRILRGELHERENPPIKPLRSARPEPRVSGLCLTLRLGEWASIGNEVFVGVSRLTGGRTIVGFKVPNGMPVCHEDVWKSLDDTSQSGTNQI
jgi:sRNA-binding carbon storage regulator CsrA